MSANLRVFDHVPNYVIFVFIKFYVCQVFVNFSNFFFEIRPVQALNQSILLIKPVPKLLKNKFRVFTSKHIESIVIFHIS